MDSSRPYRLLTLRRHLRPSHVGVVPATTGGIRRHPSSPVTTGIAFDIQARPAASTTLVVERLPIVIVKAQHAWLAAVVAYLERHYLVSFRREEARRDERNQSAVPNEERNLGQRRRDLDCLSLACELAGVEVEPL